MTYLIPRVCRVVNELGAGRPRQARMAVLATLSVTPLLWAIIACIMAEPHLQALLLHLYVDGSDAVLWRTLCQLLTIVAAIELADAFQTVLGGVVQVKRQPICVMRVLAGHVWPAKLVACPACSDACQMLGAPVTASW